MAQAIREIMTPNPITLDASSNLIEAAVAMRDGDMGDVVVRDEGRVCGIVTDRDIAVRAVAEGRDVGTTRLGDICSRDLVTLTPDDSVDRAVALMRDKAIRRLPVVDDGQPIGIVSLGDLAVEQDPRSALADISAAPPSD